MAQLRAFIFEHHQDRENVKFINFFPLPSFQHNGHQYSIDGADSAGAIFVKSIKE